MRIRLIVFFGLAATCLFAQPKQNSPYSRFGIGDPVNQFFAHHGAMGGLATAIHDPFHLNIVNPASYAHLRATALEAGVYAKYSNFATAKSELSAWSGNLNYLALGMTLKSPINEVLDRKKTPWQLGTAFALTPFSLVGYNIETRDTLPQVGIVTNAFEGRGGLYRATWGGAAKYKNTAFGFNLGFHFGKTAYENTTSFLDSVPTFQDNFRDEISVKGVKVQLGAQHDIVLARDVNDKETPSKWLTLGATFSTNTDLNARADILRIRSRGRLTNGSYDSPDTLFFDPARDITLTLPGSISLGLTYVNANKFKVGAQFTRENWSKYENGARPETMRNTNSFAAGLEYIPNAVSYNKYGKRIRYRLGAYYRQDPRIVNGKEVNDLGFSFGFGLPVILPRQGTSFINTAFEMGKIGGGTSVEETYFRITAGFTLNDNSWFYKRRFE